ncbi:unnamed protein product [Parascedosporium putredinis]|uniref:Shikimate dehydrogenase substrate binding N-terminal domain-containing protein n=1 Tax=Parascedosporium putredinis TaxID=1442378 RepID=A0A9P1MDT6_9PEZI|nr:unnamed protein product [Parascedosporium putredinis]CAI8000247.1 unnamed protein product [Parascedosporium putredinis]
MPGKIELAQPLKTYLLGYPLQHSLAPLLHSTIYKEANVPWTYQIVETQDKDGFIPTLKSDDCIGSAVTMPFKVTFMKECDEVTEEGRAIGAINTVFIRRDPATGCKKYIGTNTDCVGVREAFVQNFPNILELSTGKPALVIGGGGACRSAVYALYKWLGASEIYLVNRIKEEVDDIIASFAAIPGGGPKLRHVSAIEEIVARDISVEFLKKSQKGYVLEMCYHPNIVTEFYKTAEDNGWQVIPGTESMIYQGIAQQVLWMEKPSDQIPSEAMVPKGLPCCITDRDACVCKRPRVDDNSSDVGPCLMDSVDYSTLVVGLEGVKLRAERCGMLFRFLFELGERRVAVDMRFPET